MIKICENPKCQKEFEAERIRRRFCSLKCSTERQAVDMAKNSHKNSRMKDGQARKMGLKSREYENMVASKLKYKNIFLPQSVCDRIVVENGRVIFIEIKHKGEKLREKQKEFKSLVGERYRVIYD